MYVPSLIFLFSKPVISHIEEKAMSLSVFYYYILYLHFSLRLSHYCNLPLYYLSPFLLSYVAVSRSCRLSAFYPSLVQTSQLFISTGEEQSFESTVKAMQLHARPRNCQFSKMSTSILTKLILKALYGDYYSREARRHF